MKTRRFVVALVIGILMLGMGGARAALATPPTITELHVELTDIAPRVTSECGFTVMRSDDYYLRILTFYDQNGIATRELDLVHGTATFSANGKTVTGIYRGFDRYVFHEDGSLTRLSVAPSVMVVLPGVGPVWGQTGLMEIEYDSVGNILSVRRSGPDFFAADMCRALEP
jgi:hypothetical protein